MLERASLEAYERDRATPLGVVHETPFTTTVVDLVEDDGSKTRYPYMRILHTGELRGGNGVVVVPQTADGRFVLVEQERHATGRYHFEFPRGFAEPGVTAEALAELELEQEVNVASVRMRVLGQTYPDNGLLSAKVTFVFAELGPDQQPQPNETAIRSVALRSLKELAEEVREGIIDDGFTIQALAFLLLEGHLPQR